jgi:hypothetical protein
MTGFPMIPDDRAGGRREIQKRGKQQRPQPNLDDARSIRHQRIRAELLADSLVRDFLQYVGEIVAVLFAELLLGDRLALHEDGQH